MLSIFSKIKSWLIIAGGALAAIFFAYVKGRSDGKALEKAEQQQDREELQNEYDKIDSGKPDFDASIKRLRNRK